MTYMEIRKAIADTSLGEGPQAVSLENALVLGFTSLGVMRPKTAAIEMIDAITKNVVQQTAWKSR